MLCERQSTAQISGERCKNLLVYLPFSDELQVANVIAKPENAKYELRIDNVDQKNRTGMCFCP